MRHQFGLKVDADDFLLMGTDGRTLGAWCTGIAVQVRCADARRSAPQHADCSRAHRRTAQWRWVFRTGPARFAGPRANAIRRNAKLVRAKGCCVRRTARY